MRRADDPRRDRIGGPGIARAVSVTLLVLLIAPSVPGQDAPDLASVASEFRHAAARVLPGVVVVGGHDPVSQLSPESSMPTVSGGSGVVIDAGRGLILTANSVVEEASSRPGETLWATLPDGRSRPVVDLRQDPASDLALIAIDPTGLELHALEWGSSETLEPGDLVLSVGQAWGFSGTVSLGVVSGLRRSPGSSIHRDLIQTDALIAPGSAGGALVDGQGRLVGITLVVPGVSDRLDRIGFAVPSDRARRIASDLTDRGQVRRMAIGVRVAGIDQEQAAMLESTGAVRIDTVVVDGPADRAGLLAGDLILSVDEEPIGSPADLIASVEFASDDQPLGLGVLRDGQRMTLNVQPEPMLAAPDQGSGPMVVIPDPVEPNPPSIDDPPPSLRLPEPATSRDPTRFPSLGLRLEEPSSALTRRFGLEPEVSGMVIVGITPGGPADLGGLEPGMVVTDVLDHRIRSPADFRKAVALVPVDRDLILRIRHRGRSEFRVILHNLGSVPDRSPDPPPSGSD